MTGPHIFQWEGHIYQWEGTDNPNDPSGVATYKCDGIKVSAIFHDFATASNLSCLIGAAYERGKHDAIDKAKLTIPKLLDEHRYDGPIPRRALAALEDGPLPRRCCRLGSI
jgi:hypothetical protein